MQTCIVRTLEHNTLVKVGFGHKIFIELGSDQNNIIKKLREDVNNPDLRTSTIVWTVTHYIKMDSYF